jgi:hypothetical protein
MSSVTADSAFGPSFALNVAAIATVMMIYGLILRNPV